MTTTKSQVELSVIVCTRNRARQLATLIQCLGSQVNIENLKWEIVIVDNNSSDNTKEVAYAFCEGSNLKINYIFEEKIGLACARNSGVLASKGSLLLFVDDDVLLPREFLSNALFGLQEFNEFHIFGFKVLGDWDGVAKAPFWMSFKRPFNLSQSFLPIHDLGPEPLPYPNRKTKNPLGACFLVKKEIFEKLGPFREDIGVGQSGAHEDTEFFYFALLKKFKILYWPYAALYHPVYPNRATIRYLHKWYFDSGRSLYLVKNTGRIFNLKKKPILGIEGFISNKLPKFFEKALLKTKVFNVTVFLWGKLVVLISLLPVSLILLLFKKPFYFSTLIARNLGEIRQSLPKLKLI